jgi:hypothetical protein
VERTTSGDGPARQAFIILRFGFVALPVIVGIDKFFDRLADWERYLSDTVINLSPLSISNTMRVVGVVELVAAILVAVRPRLGGLVVAAWLALVIVNLLLIPGFYDVALRDLGLLLGALALSRLAASRAARA